MKALALVCFLYFVSSIQAISPVNLFHEEWQLFKTQYSKKYTTDIEDRLRMKIFIDNKYRIAQHNKLFHKGLVTFEQGINEYSDMLQSEFNEKMGQKSSNQRNTEANGLPSIRFTPLHNVNPPDSVDWRTKGLVGPVGKQVNCSSGYAWSAIGALEGQLASDKKKFQGISVQNVIDCSESTGNKGCSGGNQHHSYFYIYKQGGVDDDVSYPYKDAEEPCAFKKENVVTRVSGEITLPDGYETNLHESVAVYGPVAATIDATHQSFHSYKGGIYFEPDCGNKKDEVNHGVLVVGYGSENGQDYWIVKNSYGTDWGEDGYIRMARNKNNHCGIATSASVPML